MPRLTEEEKEEPLGTPEAEKIRDFMDIGLRRAVWTEDFYIKGFKGWVFVLVAHRICPEQCSNIPEQSRS